MFKRQCFCWRNTNERKKQVLPGDRPLKQSSIIDLLQERGAEGRNKTRMAWWGQQKVIRCKAKQCRQAPVKRTRQTNHFTISMSGAKYGSVQLGVAVYWSIISCAGWCAKNVCRSLMASAFIKQVANKNFQPQFSGPISLALPTWLFHVMWGMIPRSCTWVGQRGPSCFRSLCAMRCGLETQVKCGWQRSKVKTTAFPGRPCIVGWGLRFSELINMMWCGHWASAI